MTQKSIEVVEGLFSPKRSQERRQIYKSEGFKCRCLRDGINPLDLVVVDISLGGLSGVSSFESVEDFPLNYKVELELSRKNLKVKLQATIASISKVNINNNSYHRLGFKFEQKQVTNESDFFSYFTFPFVKLAGKICPQVSALDPIFYNEIIYFQLEAVSANGIYVSYSPRVKNIIPSLPLRLRVYIPGDKEYTVDVVNDTILYSTKEGRSHSFFQYKDASLEYKKSLSEYLIMFGSAEPINSKIRGSLSPNGLRDLSMPIGVLTRSLDLGFDMWDPGALDKLMMKPTYIGNANKASSTLKKDYYRCGFLKVGRLQGVFFALSFVMSDPSRSSLLEGGHDISEKIIKASHVELDHFYLSKYVKIQDVFVPFLKHIIKVSSQEEVRMLLFEVTKDILKVLEKLGFKKTGSSVKKSGQEYFLVVFDLEKFNKNLKEQSKILSIFDDLRSFLT